MGIASIETGLERGRSQHALACKRCGSMAQQLLDGELTASFPDFKRSKLPPVYVRSQLLVCLDCGFAELIIPGAELETLKQGATGSETKAIR